MKRKIITINEEKCNGCGNCVIGCPEGALRIIDGKARLVNELYCDGLGACMGECPQGAISIEERDAEPYDESKVMHNIVQQGPDGIAAHLSHLHSHNEVTLLQEAIAFLRKNKIPVPEYGVRTASAGYDAHQHVCPGSRAVELAVNDRVISTNAGGSLASSLRHWPVQLRLINPSASYLRNADLLIAADCVPCAFADFHRRFLSGKILLMFCPKLDPTIGEYVERLTEIFALMNIASITMTHMEVPCCFGVERIVREALRRSGKNIPVSDYTLSIRGEIIHEG